MDTSASSESFLFERLSPSGARLLNEKVIPVSIVLDLCGNGVTLPSTKWA